MGTESISLVTVEFQVAAEGIRFTAHADVPAGETNLTQILPVLQDMDNALIHGVVSNLAEEGVAVSCRAGCGACCRQLVTLSIFEAEALADWIHTLPAERQQQLAQRFDQAMRKLADAGIAQRIVDEHWIAGSGSAHQLALDYFWQGIPCPFLEEESCSIHPIRPLICREFLVSSPAERCANLNLEERPVPIRMPLNLSRVLIRMGAELEGSRCGWIPVVFLFAWMKSGSKPGQAIAGEGPRVLYEFVSRLNEAQTPGAAEAEEAVTEQLEDAANEV